MRLGRTAVLSRPSVATGELTVFDGHEQSDRLRLGIHRPNDHRSHAGTKSSPRNPVGSRDRHGGWMGGKQRIAADADHFFDIRLGFPRPGRRARAAEILPPNGAYWSATPRP